MRPDSLLTGGVRTGSSYRVEAGTPSVHGDVPSKVSLANQRSYSGT